MDNIGGRNDGYDDLKNLALIEYFIAYQSTLDPLSGDDSNKISRFTVPRHSQWIGWLIEPADEDQ